MVSFRERDVMCALVLEDIGNAQARESQRLDDLQKMEPPVVQTPNYPWPTKMMVRPSSGREEARVINLQIVPSEVYDDTSEVNEWL
ncbi:hypothetical protein PHMEG_00019397 [Phytophthora megakarya]|uniref:Uncharacterized protein n=1 Tax=Phytophthora megakarya TaxID=4795 RepID=A0A225VRF4_9STRA|nr:hypothetical protein PHMEG_00019397 [Phytophthora megakarya]